MANKKLFQSAALKAPEADTINRAGGKAYSRSAKEALAQYASTGMLAGTFYDTAQSQLDKVIDLAEQSTPEFLAKVAIFCRMDGFMKDMPAALLSVLATKDTELFKSAFPLVVNNGRMLRNFVQIMRSGAVGRKSLGSSPKSQVQHFLTERPLNQLFRDAVGNKPSVKDVIKMVHPKPRDTLQAGMFSYLIDKPLRDGDEIPKFVHEFEAFKRGELEAVPNGIPWRRLTALDLSEDNWKQIAATAPYHATRMNINTFMRHKCFEGKGAKKLVRTVTDRLRNPELIRRNHVFPYQLMAAFMNADSATPYDITSALQDAMEIAVENVPKFKGQVALGIDTSGSMRSPVTGQRGTATTSMRYVDVAALVAAAVLKKNPTALVLPFDTQLHHKAINPRDSVMTNAKILADFCGGGTACSLPLSYINQKREHIDLMIYVSDDQSWADGGRGDYGCWPSAGIQTMDEWRKLKRRCKKAKMVCINIDASPTTQAKTDDSILNIGGFSDRIFRVIDAFAKTGERDYWVKKIEEIEL